MSQSTLRITNQSRPTIPIRAGISRLDADRGERESLKELGEYLHTTPQGLAILKIKSVPSIGTDVVDEKGRQVGSVADVFGPVASPYASVKLITRTASHLELDGAELYTLEGKRSSKRGMYGRP